jgi:glucose/arabinose dehydrogenase
MTSGRRPGGITPKPSGIAALLAAALLTAACGEQSRLPEHADVGPKPTLVAPQTPWIPTVHIAPAERWPAGQMPLAAEGTRVEPFAAGLSHPRWLHVLPNGDVLVAETSAPPRPQEGQGFKGWVMGQLMKRAGAAVPSANRITLLRDADGDGRAEVRSVFLQGLNAPFGMALVGDRLYVANTDALVEFPYVPGATRIDTPGRRIADLPAGPRNHHWTKSLLASPDGTKLYVGVGSNSNVAENGLAEEQGRAAIWEIDRASGARRVFASGLRNPVGLAWWPGADGRPVLWVVVNERDELGSDLVPDYLTAVPEGAFFGWPWSWWGGHVDERVEPPAPEQVARAREPDYALGSHVAPLGLAATGPNPLTTALAEGRVAEGLFVGEHGSWNRRPRAGYQVVFVPFANGRPSGLPVRVLTGFVGPDGHAWGRPAGVAMDGRGGLLVADDVGDTVWRVTPR